MNNPTLKSCLICGSIQTIHVAYGRHADKLAVQCEDCGTVGPAKATVIEADVAWNERGKSDADRLLTILTRNPPVNDESGTVCCSLCGGFEEDSEGNIIHEPDCLLVLAAKYLST